MKHAEQFIPYQETGSKTHFLEEKTFENQAQAHKGFKRAAARLLTVSEWHNYAGPGSSRFCLSNNLGDEVTGFATEGFLFSIDLPVAGSSAGDGLEWVMVERIDANENANAAEEFVAMTVRPVPDPRKTDPQTAHFYEDISTSTFIIKRAGKTLSAAVHGRNETPNNSDVNFHDKVRNTLVALTARIGMSALQWKKLVKGLLEQF